MSPSSVRLASALKVIIAGGGTGGHLFPALALAEQLASEVPGCQVHFVGSRGGIEERVVPQHGYPLHLLRLGKLRGTGVLTQLQTMLKLPWAGAAALMLVKRLAPHVVVGVGGYASGPLVVAAALVRCPVLLMEQNAIPGTTNRILARFADRIIIGFRQAARYFPAERTLLLGNPVRPEVIRALMPTSSHDQCGAPRAAGESLQLLVLGGSQGARAINQLMVEAAPLLLARLPRLRLVHQTGQADLRWVREQYQRRGVPAQVEAFIDNIGAAYAQADLVVGRSGATTIAELCVAGLPALLVPYPFAADDHQAKNAAEAVAAGGARMARQHELTPQILADKLIALLSEPTGLVRMGQGMQACAYPGAASAAVQVIQALSKHERGSTP